MSDNDMPQWSNTEVHEAWLTGQPVSKAMAKQITTALKSAMDKVQLHMQRAIAGQVWIPLGYDTFTDWYVANEFHELRFTNKEREEVILQLFADDVSLAAISRLTGAAYNTVKDKVKPKAKGPKAKGPKKAPAPPVLCQTCDMVPKDCRCKNADDEEGGFNTTVVNQSTADTEARQPTTESTKDEVPTLTADRAANELPSLMMAVVEHVKKVVEKSPMDRSTDERTQVRQFIDFLHDAADGLDKYLEDGAPLAITATLDLDEEAAALVDTLSA